MNYTSLRKKPHQRPVKTQKKRFKLGFGAVFFFFFLTTCLAFSYSVFSATIFEDDFDSYGAGTLAGQGGWTCDYTTWQVITTQYNSSPNGIADYASSFVSRCKKTGIASTTEGAIGFSFKTTNCGYGATRRELLEFQFTGAPYSSYPKIGAKSTIDNGCEISLSAISDTDYVAMNTFNDWTDVVLRWKLIGNVYWFRWGWGGQAETAWTESAYTTGVFPTGFDRIQLYGTYGAGGNYFYFDDIVEPPEFCSTFNDFNSCTLNGCFWGYYTLYLGGNPTGYCTDEPTGECASGYDDCQNCTTQETCEAEDFCFWYLDTCRYGETACAGASLWLCENESDCTTAGGYWYDDFCWLSAKPTYFTDWEDWYAEHGGYATSTAFVDSLASSSTSFFEFFGGFFDTFNSVFNLQDATERGLALGGVVPAGRGYLLIFNEFLGGFPISEFFIFFLTFMLVIGIIRLFTRLLPMLKFW